MPAHDGVAIRQVVDLKPGVEPGDRVPNTGHRRSDRRVVAAALHLLPCALSCQVVQVVTPNADVRISGAVVVGEHFDVRDRRLVRHDERDRELGATGRRAHVDTVRVQRNAGIHAREDRVAGGQVVRVDLTRHRCEDATNRSRRRIAMIETIREPAAADLVLNDLQLRRERAGSFDEFPIGDADR